MSVSGNYEILARTNTLLKERLQRLAPATGKFETKVSGLIVIRFDEFTEYESSIYDPMIGVVIQDDKQTMIGGEVFRYGANTCFVSGVDMPSLNSTIHASADEPFLGFLLRIDRELAMQLNAEAAPMTVSAESSFSGVSLAPVSLWTSWMRFFGSLNSWIFRRNSRSSRS